jgi:hypothetical protein
MRWKTTAVLALIFLAVGIFYYAYEIRLAPGREKAEREKGRLWSVEAKDVEEAIFKRRGDTVHLKREGDDWQLLVPVKARAEKTVVQDIVANLVTAKADREIEPNPSKLDDFGLDKPAAEIILRVKGKSEPLTLLLGGKNPTGVWVYAKTADKPAVFVLSDFILRDATKPFADFRDRTILAFDRKAVTGLEVNDKGQLLAAEPEGTTGWRITRPMPFKADEERIADFLDKLLFTKVKEFVVEAPPLLLPYGLDQPAQVTIWLGKEKDRTSQRLLLGKVDAAKKGVYAMRPGEQSVLLLGEEIWNLLPRTVFDLRDKTLISHGRDKLVKLALDSPRGTVSLAREGQEWRITAPESLKADEGAVSAYLWKLQDLKAQAFVTDGAAAVGRYLSKPEVRVSFWEKDAQAPKTLLLGPSSERRDGKLMAYAAVLGQGPLVLVEAKFLQEMAKSVTDFRDRILLGSFETKDVKRLQIKSGGQTMLIERRGENQWRLLEPKKGKAREGAVNDLLLTLRALKWSEQVSVKGEEGARYGLDQPSFEVTLWKSDGSEMASLIVGRKDKDKAYLKTRASPSLYAVPAKQLGNLPTTPDDLR